MNQSTCKLLSSRGDFSSGRLDELRRHLKNEPALKAYSGLPIYAAGSFARGEASKYSDIDLFFLHNDLTVQVSEPRLKGIRVLSTVIRQIEEDMEFPAPSNDGQFMNIIKLSEMKKTLGGAEGFLDVLSGCGHGC